MKTLIYVFFLLVVPINLQAQTKEIPITTSSKEALDLFLQGREKLENVENNAAALLFDEAIKKDPNFAMAYLYRSNSGGNSKIVQDNLDKAVSLTDKVSEGEKLQIFYAKETASGNGLKRKEYLDQLLTKFSSEKRIQLLAGYYFYNIHDYLAATKYLKKSIELDSKYAPAYNLLGYCQSALNNYHDAEKAFEDYIKLIPDKANPYDSYAELLLKQGKYDESITQYNKAIEKDPLFNNAYVGIGNNYIFKGDYSNARKYYQECFDKAFSLNLKLNALYFIAISYVHEGNVEQGIKTIDELNSVTEKENIKTNVIYSYITQGYILSESGNPDEGLKYCEKGLNLLEELNLSDTEKDAFNINSMFWHIYFYTANNNLDKAANEIEKCKQIINAKKNPNYTQEFNSLLGFNELKKGSFDNAIQYLSAKELGNNPWNWYYLGIAYKQKGDKQNATLMFEKITKWNVNSIDLAFVRKRAMDELKKM